MIINISILVIWFVYLTQYVYASISSIDYSIVILFDISSIKVVNDEVN